tara:strand:+ start:101 stop:1129 length:1029 start_codon:yes stop_codon:yes gene_type:complete
MKRHWLSAIHDANPQASYKFSTVYVLSTLISSSTKNIEQNQPLRLKQRDIAIEYLQLFWDTYLIHDIEHFIPTRIRIGDESNERKQSEIMQLVNHLWNDYSEYANSNEKIRFEKFLRKINKIEPLQIKLERTLKRTYTNMRKMPFFYMKMEGVLYDFDSLGDLIINKDAANAVILTYPLIKYASMIELTKYLERINSSKEIKPGIMSILFYISPNLKTRRPGIKRVCRELIEEFHSSESEVICSSCHKPIYSNSALDHTIPWIKIRNHDIWNLHPTHRSCNGSKNDNPPHDAQIRIVQSRNERMLKYFIIQNYEFNEQKKYVEILDASIESNELWNKYVRMC